MDIGLPSYAPKGTLQFFGKKPANGECLKKCELFLKDAGYLGQISRLDPPRGLS